MNIAHTRNMVRAAIDGELDGVRDRRSTRCFGVAVPVHVPGVPDEVLDPRDTWADKAAYDATARRLAAMFHVNFARTPTACPRRSARPARSRSTRPASRSTRVSPRADAPHA